MVILTCVAAVSIVGTILLAIRSDNRFPVLYAFVIAIIWIVIAAITPIDIEYIPQTIDKFKIIECPSKIVVIDSTGLVQEFYDLKSFNSIKVGDTLYYKTEKNFFGIKSKTCLTFEK